MLKELAISSYALIDNLKISFYPGFNVLTGETGAGKSIILDALSLVLGGRGSPGLIRSGAETARVDAVFDIGSGSPAVQVLKEMGLPSDEVLVLSREISRSGRGMCRVNGAPATATMMRRLGACLVEVHEQHGHHQLLDPAAHRGILDLFGGRELACSRERVAELAQSLSKVRGQRLAVEACKAERLQRMDLLEFQIREITEARLEGVDEDRLQERRQVMVHAQRLMELAAGAYSQLYEGFAGRPAIAAEISQLASEVRHGARIDPSLGPVADILDGVVCQLQEVARDLRCYREGLSFDPEELAELESRLEKIRRLKRKYGASVAEILEYREQAAAELERLTSAAASAAELEGQESGLAQALAAEASRLSKMREQAARRMEEAVGKQLADIGMAGAVFMVKLWREESPDGIPFGSRRVAWDSSGIDRVEFCFSANKGEPLQDLADIASGGEAARVMLAIRAALAALSREEGERGAQTLVFDEIDSGIGGIAGQAVGKKLSEVARNHQVLCVTHLPQVAASAQHHFYVEKIESNGRTKVSVRLLSEDERPLEIARMLSGSMGTASLAHAREILSKANAAR